MSKCKDCEEITSLLIGMRNYYLLADFRTRTSPKYTNLVRTRHTARWDLTRNSRSLRAGGLTIRVENGCDEVNLQISAKYKYVFSQQIMLGQENVTTYVPEIKLRSNSI